MMFYSLVSPLVVVFTFRCCTAGLLDTRLALLHYLPHLLGRSPECSNRMRWFSVTSEVTHVAPTRRTKQFTPHSFSSVIDYESASIELVSRADCSIHLISRRIEDDSICPIDSAQNEVRKSMISSRSGSISDRSTMATSLK